MEDGRPRTPEECRQALKALKQTERLYEKLARRPLSNARRTVLATRRDQGLLTSDDLPARIAFPASLRGRTLDEVEALCSTARRR